MSLNIQKLEMVRKLAGGVVQARCPACAEGGADKTGNHLRIQADGRFGCCVHPKDGDHRKRIFALVGARDRQAIRVTVGGPKVAKIIQSDVLGRLGRVFATPTGPTAPKITTDGTLGTTQYPYMCERNNLYTYKDNRSSVPNVPELQLALDSKPRVPSVPIAEVTPDSQIPVPSVPLAMSPETIDPNGNESPVLPDGHHERLPYLTPGGTLVIPFDSPERYHWWKPDGERQSVATTMAEVRSRMSETKKG